MHLKIIFCLFFYFLYGVTSVQADEVEVSNVTIKSFTYKNMGKGLGDRIYLTLAYEDNKYPVYQFPRYIDVQYYSADSFMFVNSMYISKTPLYVKSNLDNGKILTMSTID